MLESLREVDDVMRRGIVAGSLGAVLGGALGGGTAYALYVWLDPVLEAAGSPLEELQGIVSSLVLLGLGAGLALGCALGLWTRAHGSVLVTTLVLLAALPFAAPLVALATWLHWSAAPVAGVVIVTGVVAVTRLVVTRGAQADASPASPPGDTAGLAPPGRG